MWNVQVSQLLMFSTAMAEFSLVCVRMMKSIKSYASAQGIKNSEGFEKYCAIPTLDVDEQKFCYNTDTLRMDILRLLDLGADENRLCKKVKSINPDFCLVKAPKISPVNEFVSKKRGIIYI